MNDSRDEKITDPQLVKLEERLRSLRARKTRCQAELQTEFVEQSLRRRRSWQRRTFYWNHALTAFGTAISIFVMMILFKFHHLIQKHSPEPPQGNPEHVSQIITEPNGTPKKFAVSTVRQQLGMMLDEIQNEKPIELKKPVYRVVEIPLDKRKEPQLHRELDNENYPLLRAKTLQRNDFESLFL